MKIKLKIFYNWKHIGSHLKSSIETIFTKFLKIPNNRKISMYIYVIWIRKPHS